MASVFAVVQALQTLELWSESLRHATVWWNVTITLSVLASSSSYRNSIIKNASPALGLISDAKKENRNIILRFSERVEVFGQEKLLPLNKQSNSNTENFVFNWIMKRFFQHLPKGSGLLWTKPTKWSLDESPHIFYCDFHCANSKRSQLLHLILCALNSTFSPPFRLSIFPTSERVQSFEKFFFFHKSKCVFLNLHLSL